MNETPIKHSEAMWDDFFMGMALQAATGSKDPDRKVGAVLVTPDRRQLSFGYNGFPNDIPDKPSLLADRDFKRAHMVHAEDNCLRQAPFSSLGCTMYVTRFPCLHCATKLRLSGIARLVAPRPDFGHARWGQSWSEAVRTIELGRIPISYHEIITL